MISIQILLEETGRERELWTFVTEEKCFVLFCFVLWVEG